jgi:hypothetical protein
MHNIERTKKHMEAIIVALNNVEYGRMPIAGYLDKIFESRVESGRNLISAMKREELADKAV